MQSAASMKMTISKTGTVIIRTNGTMKSINPIGNARKKYLFMWDAADFTHR